MYNERLWQQELQYKYSQNKSCYKSSKQHWSHWSKQPICHLSPEKYRKLFGWSIIRLINIRPFFWLILRLSLPTLSNIEQAVKNCHVSSLDLKNQFFSIELHPESKPKTNFYYQNQIFQRERLPMGLSTSPYIATMAMKFTFSDSV